MGNQPGVDRIKTTKQGATQAGYYYSLNDHLGTSQKLIDQQGQIVWSMKATAFGETTVDTNSLIENPFRFPGQYLDRETQAHYNYYRDYEPLTGRYVQSDPIGINKEVVLYKYAKNIPLRIVDNKGLFVRGSGCSDNQWSQIGIEKQKIKKLLDKECAGTCFGGGCIPLESCPLFNSSLNTSVVNCMSDDEYVDGGIPICGRGTIGSGWINVYPNTFSKNCTGNGRYCAASPIFHELVHNVGFEHDGKQIKTKYGPMDSTDSIEYNCRDKLCGK